MVKEDKQQWFMEHGVGEATILRGLTMLDAEHHIWETQHAKDNQKAKDAVELINKGVFECTHFLDGKLKLASEDDNRVMHLVDANITMYKSMLAYIRDWTMDLLTMRSGDKGPPRPYSTALHQTVKLAEAAGLNVDAPGYVYGVKERYLGLINADGRLTSAARDGAFYAVSVTARYVLEAIMEGKRIVFNKECVDNEETQDANYAPVEDNSEDAARQVSDGSVRRVQRLRDDAVQAGRRDGIDSSRAQESSAGVRQMRSGAAAAEAKPKQSDTSSTEGKPEQPKQPMAPTNVRRMSLG